MVPRSRMGMLVWKRSSAWMGFVPSGSGMGMLLGSRTATPQRLLWCGSMPIIVSLVSFVGFG